MRRERPLLPALLWHSDAERRAFWRFAMWHIDLGITAAPVDQQIHALHQQWKADGGATSEEGEGDAQPRQP